MNSLVHVFCWPRTLSLLGIYLKIESLGERVGSCSGSASRALERPSQFTVTSGSRAALLAPGRACACISGRLGGVQWRLTVVASMTNKVGRLFLFTDHRNMLFCAGSDRLFWPIYYVIFFTLGNLCVCVCACVSQIKMLCQIHVGVPFNEVFIACQSVPTH